MRAEDSSNRARSGRPGLHRQPGPGRWRRAMWRAAGLAAGVGIACAAAPSFEVAAGPPALPLVVNASVVRSGEVGTVAGGQLLTGAEVRPGPDGSVQGRLGLASETSVPVDLTVQDVGLPTGLEEQLWLRVTLGDVVVFDGTQAQLRRSPSLPARVLPGTEVPIGITASLPTGGPDGHQGRRTELKLRISSPAVPA